MKRFRFKHDYEREAAELVRFHTRPSDADDEIDSDAVAETPDGDAAITFLKGRLDLDLCKATYALARSINTLPMLRMNAAGDVSRDGSVGLGRDTAARLRKNGVGTVTLGVVRGRLSQITSTHRELLTGNRMLIEAVDELYRQHCPKVYAKQLATVRKLPRSWRIFETTFSTVYLSRNWDTCYHRDANLRGTLTCILATGDFVGGQLVLPRWRIAVAYKPGDLAIFNGRDIHGNLPIFGTRVSAMLYCDGRIG